MSKPSSAALWHLVRVILGWGAVVVGILTFILPIPIGLILMAVGVVTLLPVSPRVQRGMIWVRRRWPHLFVKLKRLRPILPESLQKFIFEPLYQKNSPTSQTKSDPKAGDQSP